MIKFSTAGDGYWSSKKSEVSISEFVLLLDEVTFGELQVYFEEGWDVESDGLIYTDSLFLECMKQYFNERNIDCSDLDYSEQGMQGLTFVSCDVGPKFIKSWINSNRPVVER